MKKYILLLIVVIGTTICTNAQYQLGMNIFVEQGVTNEGHASLNVIEYYPLEERLKDLSKNGEKRTITMHKETRKGRVFCVTSIKKKGQTIAMRFDEKGNFILNIDKESFTIKVEDVTRSETFPYDLIYPSINSKEEKYNWQLWEELNEFGEKYWEKYYFKF
ncbi:hypothetical protein HOD29_02615 [archaeon]|jgi:hypothetical protein|nr:hypothetical protein [archaeon]